MRRPRRPVDFFQARARVLFKVGANRSGLAVTPLRSGYRLRWQSLAVKAGKGFLSVMAMLRQQPTETLEVLFFLWDYQPNLPNKRLAADNSVVGHPVL